MRKHTIAVWLIMFLMVLPCRAENPNQWRYGYDGTDADTIALWHLDDDATGRLDSTGNNHDWDDSQYPVVWDPNGKFNGAVEYAFGSAPPRILKIASTGSNTLGASESSLTLELWFKTDRAQQQAFLFTGLATEGYAIRVDNDPGVGRYIEAVLLVDNVGYVGLFSTSPIDDNQWHHIALTRNKATGETKLYFDGAVEALVTIGAGENLYGQEPANGVAARLGWPLISPGLGFYGLIDEVRLSRVVRTFAVDPNEPDASTTALWHLNGSLADSSDNGRDFDTIQGAGFDWDPNGYSGSAGSFTYPTVGFLEKTGAGFNALGISESDFTIELWFKTDVNQPAAVLFTGIDTEGYMIRTNPSGTHIEAVLQPVGIGYLGLFSTSPIADGRWHNVALTRNKTTGETKLYFDGMLEDKVTRGAGKNLNGLNPASTIGARIGWPMQAGIGFNGLIDEIRLSNAVRDISSCQVDIFADISGQEGERDCKVDMFDFAVLASEWLEDHTGELY